MLKLPSSLQKLINELSKLPGIGPKSAQRLAFYLLKKSKIDTDSLSAAVGNVREGVTFCSVCHTMAETDPCSVCGDEKRDHSVICVVEEPLDALAIDKTGQFNGVFHVLGGVLNPLEGIGPEKLNVESLIKRISSDVPTRRESESRPGRGDELADQEISGSEKQLTSPLPDLLVKEIIIATNPSLEGETTAMHLSKIIGNVNQSISKSANQPIKITRIARGLPMGGDLEYADDITLTRALEGRREF